MMLGCTALRSNLSMHPRTRQRADEVRKLVDTAGEDAARTMGHRTHTECIDEPPPASGRSRSLRSYRRGAFCPRRVRTGRSKCEIPLPVPCASVLDIRTSQ